MNENPYGEPSRTGAPPWLRLLAFWFDLTLVAAPVKLLLFLLDAERYEGFVLSLYGLGPSLLVIVTSLPLMALTTNRWGTTLGKRLLGCSVYPTDHLTVSPSSESKHAIGFTRAYKRAFVSYAVGTGMSLLPELTALSLFFCYRGLKYRGVTFWDAVYKTRVMREPVRPALTVVFAIGLILLRLADLIPLFLTVYLPYLREVWRIYMNMQ